MDEQLDQRFDQAVNYIRQYFGQGVPENDIRDAFRQANWDEKLINDAFKFVESPPHTFMPHSPKPPPATLPPPGAIESAAPQPAAQVQQTTPATTTYLPGTVTNPGQPPGQMPGFDPNALPKRSSTGKIIFLIFFLFLLLGAAAGAAYWFLLKAPSIG